MRWLKKKYEDAKRGIKDEMKHRKEVKRVEKESYRAARIKQAETLGRKKVEYETQQKLNDMRKPKAAYTFGGFAGPTARQPSPSVGVADYLSGGRQKARNAPTNDLGSILGGAPRRKGRNVNQELRGMGL